MVIPPRRRPRRLVGNLASGNDRISKTRLPSGIFIQYAAPRFYSQNIPATKKHGSARAEDIRPIRRAELLFPAAEYSRD